MTGTTVIAVKTLRESILAADTKLRKVGDREATDAGRIHKIANVGNLFFAAARLLGDTQGKFNLTQIITTASERNPPLQKKSNDSRRWFVLQTVCCIEFYHEDRDAGQAQPQAIRCSAFFCVKIQILIWTSVTFINDFANAIAFLAPLTGGENRPNVVVRNLTENDAVRMVETIFQFAVRASSSA